MNRIISRFPRYFLNNPRILSNSIPSRLCATNVGSHSENHTPVWNAERLLSAGLIGVMPLSFMLQSPIMDYPLALSMVLHIHWGVEAVVVDYIRPRVFGNIIPKLALYSVYALSIATLAGLFYFNYTDIGVVQGVKMAMKM
ncbi:succinate dehydrogenase [ubiquinone] cytochrome b small subunit, mitochondrial-like [Panonychus citri]|uniref:succinate dehydrogenase [ubiquinone] cytochrome b small subunit, mitochondrial-like n=1 Tax=Panonychus citri TaxID=50023 RepID=UPI0023082A26|nr:succinate dehydrogenase [ubiquinone] cytochrome b small subunit, mitochondrial-like [Panonychus citri]WDE17736.1 mitochondrial succinate dehydrogenase cytochrome b small subunit [Panonychus citri]WDE17737.1 mitochondrial succinate dehydrogenase cytochrome b small subunit [Panonychus ulmi]